MSDELYVISYKPNISNDKLYFAYRNEDGRFVFTKYIYEAEQFDFYEAQVAQDEISEALGIEINIEDVEDE